MRTAGLGRALLIAAVAAFGVPVLMVALIVIIDFDPAPDRFEVGATVSPDGAVMVLLGDCIGGELRRISVVVEREPGDHFREERVWAVAARRDTVVDIPPFRTVDVQLGVAPPGMFETVPLQHALLDEPLNVSVHTSVQSYGFFFTISDLEPGKVFAEGRGLLSLQGFRGAVGRVCERCCITWQDVSVSPGWRGAELRPDIYNAWLSDLREEGE